MVQSSGMVIALAAAFTFLSLLSVGLRIWARQVKRLTLGPDDILIILAVVCRHVGSGCRSLNN